MERRGWSRSYVKRDDPICKCDHPQVCHYTKDGRCVYDGCPCKSYQSKGRPEFANIKRSQCSYQHSHRSGIEIKTCAELHYRKMAGEIKDFCYEPLTDLFGPSGSVIATYKVDFKVDHKDGSTEWIECKGAHLQNEGQWPLKWKLLQDRFKGDPKHKFRVVLG